MSIQPAQSFRCTLLLKSFQGVLQEWIMVKVQFHLVLFGGRESPFGVSDQLLP